MVDKILIDIINEERKKLRMYFYWQLFWGIIFVLLVLVSSVFFGLKNKEFWIYVIMPLIVLGSFWVFVQSSFDNVNLRYKQKVLKVIIERYFIDFNFYPDYKLNKQVFELNFGFKSIFRLSSRNAITGEIEDLPITMCYYRIDKQTERGVLTIMSGIYINVDLDFTLPKFAIYPQRQDLKEFFHVSNLKELQTKLSEDFIVYSESKEIISILEKIGPDILKYSNICAKPENFILTTFNNRLNLLFVDGREFINFSLKEKVSEQIVKNEIKHLKNCLEFTRKLLLHLSK